MSNFFSAMNQISDMRVAFFFLSVRDQRVNNSRVSSYDVFCSVFLVCVFSFTGLTSLLSYCALSLMGRDEEGDGPLNL